MTISKESWYDKEKNIAVVHISGTPDCLMDIDLLVADAIEEWGSFDYKVYTIADISDLGKITYSHMTYYTKKMKELFKNKSELSVVVSNSMTARVALRLFKFVSNAQLQVVSTLDEALEIISQHQKVHGVYPKLD